MSSAPIKPARGPRVFVGSSREGLKVAETLQVLLDYDCEVELWGQGVFEPGGHALGSLARAARSFDFAVLVVSPDDTTESRGRLKNTTRDNVIFELGLFMGALGSERTYMISDPDHKPDLPSDLDGVTSVTYAVHTTGNWTAALGAAATQLKTAFTRLGSRSSSDQRQSENVDGLRSLNGPPDGHQHVETDSDHVKVEPSRSLTSEPKAPDSTRWSDRDVARAVGGLPSSPTRTLIEELLRHAAVHDATQKGGTGRVPSAGFYYSVAGKRCSLWSLYLRPDKPSIALNFGSLHNVSGSIASAAYEAVADSPAVLAALGGRLSHLTRKYPEIPVASIARDETAASGLFKYLAIALKEAQP